MSKIVCIGECLVDVMPTPTGYENRIGGAPYNVCACVANLGGEGYYLGKLGGDEYARFLLEKIEQSGVNMSYICIDKSLITALARITLDKNGDRSFSFFRENTADLNLCEDDIHSGIFQSGDILHFCSVALKDKSLYAHKKAINNAKNAGAIISFDVNIRLNLWDSKEECIAVIKEFLQYADVLKLSDDELDLLADCNFKSEQEKVKHILSTARNAKLLIVTKGSKGAIAYKRDLTSVFEPSKKIDVKNTTGAGDNFVGAVLYKLSQEKNALENLSDDKIKSILHFASEHTAKFLVNN